MNEPATLLIYLLLFIGILLVNYLLQRAAARQRQQEASQQDIPRPAASVPVRLRPPLPAYRSPLAAELPVHPRGMADTSAAAPSRRSSAGSFLRSRQDLRRAIIAMTVLGPCRAQQPPDMSR